jgi:hypothetical protein
VTTLQNSYNTAASRRAAISNFARWSPRTAALVAGFALALMAVLAGLGNFGAIVPLITPGDATETAHAISDSRLLFLSGVGCLFIVTLLDILVAGALYTLFRPVHRALSAVAAWMRVVFAVLFMVAISQLVVGFSLLNEPEAALPHLEAFNTVWVISLGLFGIHLLLIGYLAFRSGFVPRIFGILLAIAGLAYLADAVGMMSVADFSATFAAFGFVGEVAIIFWLFIKGRRLARTEGPKS